MFSVIVAGSRNFNNYELLKTKLDFYLSQKSPDEIEIVSGCAKGADTLAIKYARENNLAFKEFPADWKNEGKSAGMKRNTRMADYADALVAFWDGKSVGTKDMIEKMHNRPAPVRIVRF